MMTAAADEFENIKSPKLSQIDEASKEYSFEDFVPQSALSATKKEQLNLYQGGGDYGSVEEIIEEEKEETPRQIHVNWNI